MMDVTHLLQELIKIPSVNPRFESADKDTVGEKKLSDWLAEYLKQNGFEVKQGEVLPGRHNLTAYYKGKTPSAIALNAHLDTVPVEGMRVDPFAGTIIDGKITGRGSADTKASMAAAITAAILEKSSSDCPSILLVFTCDEENGFTGAQYFHDNNKYDIAGVVIGEPTSLKLISTHKGVYRTKIKTSGIAAHASVPHRGDNAIYKMAKVVAALEKLGDELLSRPAHPLLKTATLSVGTIEGGVAVNSVPDSCVIDLDRRVLPDETFENIEKEISDALSGITGVEIEDAYMKAPGFSIEQSSMWYKFVADALGVTEGGLVNYTTDASFMHSDKMPCVVIGPGSPDAAHVRDESIEISELEKGVECFRKIISSYK